MTNFTPKRFPSILVYYDCIPGQRQTNWQPGFEAQIEFTGVEINNENIDFALEEHLIETFGDDWENEIKKGEI